MGMFEINIVGRLHMAFWDPTDTDLNAIQEK